MKGVFPILIIFILPILNGLQKKTNELPLPKSKGVWSLEWSPGDTFFAFGGDDSMLHIYRASDHSLYRSYKAKSMIKALSWRPDGKILAIAVNGGVQFLDMRSEHLITLPGLTT